MFKSLLNRFRFLSLVREKARLWRLKSRQLISSRNYWKNRSAYQLLMLEKAYAHLKWFRYVVPDEADNIEGFYEFCNELEREIGD